MANAPVAGTEEEQATQPDSVTPDSTSEENTSPENEGDSTSQEAELTPDSHLESFIKEQGLSSETEGGTDGTEPDSSEPSPEVLAQAQQLAEAERQAERKQREQESIKTAFSQRTQNLRTAMLSKGIDPQFVEQVVNEFVIHNGQIAPVAKAEAMQEAINTFNESLFDTAGKNISGLKGRKDFKSLDDFMKVVTTEARKGYVSEKDHKADVAAKLLDYKKSLEEKGFIASKAPAGDNDTVGSDNQDSLEFSLNAPIDQIIAARQKRAY